MVCGEEKDAVRTTIDLSLRQNGDMRDLIITRKTFINRSLAAIYDVSFSFNGDWMPYQFSAGFRAQRGGDAGQHVVDVFHPGGSSPTKRGVALMDIFLCEPTQLRPITWIFPS